MAIKDLRLPSSERARFYNTCDDAPPTWHGQQRRFGTPRPAELSSWSSSSVTSHSWPFSVTMNSSDRTDGTQATQPKRLDQPGAMLKYVSRVTFSMSNFVRSESGFTSLNLPESSLMIESCEVQLRRKRSEVEQGRVWAG